MKDFPWSDFLFVVLVVSLVVLCAGDPDLIDAMVYSIMEQPEICNEH